MAPNKQKKAWRDFDEDMCDIIQVTSAGNIDRRLQTISQLIVGYASERFGHIEKIGNKVNTLNRREERIKKAGINIPQNEQI